MRLSQVSVDQRFIAGLADAWAMRVTRSCRRLEIGHSIYHHRCQIFVWKEQDYLRKMSSDVSSIIQMNQNCLEALCRLGLHLEDLLLLVFSDDYPTLWQGLST